MFKLSTGLVFILLSILGQGNISDSRLTDDDDLRAAVQAFQQKQGVNGPIPKRRPLGENEISSDQLMSKYGAVPMGLEKSLSFKNNQPLGGTEITSDQLMSKYSAVPAGLEKSPSFANNLSPGYTGSKAISEPNTRPAPLFVPNFVRAAHARNTELNKAQQEENTQLSQSDSQPGKLSAIDSQTPNLSKVKSQSSTISQPVEDEAVSQLLQAAQYPMPSNLKSSSLSPITPSGDAATYSLQPMNQLGNRPSASAATYPQEPRNLLREDQPSANFSSGLFQSPQQLSTPDESEESQLDGPFTLGSIFGGGPEADDDNLPVEEKVNQQETMINLNAAPNPEDWEAKRRLQPVYGNWVPTNVDYNLYKDIVVERSNEYRAKHHSPPLVYDVELSKMSQAYAEKLFNTPPEQRKHDDSNDIGENFSIYAMPYKTFQLPPTTIVDGWYGENVNYNYKNGKSLNGKTIGHFMQLVWKGSQKVGFGIKKGINIEGETEFVVVCKYDPPKFSIRFAKNVFAP